MATNNAPSRFASTAPQTNAPEKLDDFAMISLDSVEKMLRDTGEGDSRPLGNDYIPPPIFDGTNTKPAPRSPVLVAAATPPVKATPSPATASRFRYADMVRADGKVDTDAVYRYGQVPAVPLSAELLLQALCNLPADIPADARQIALKVTVNSLTQSAGIRVESVIADALLRHTRLSQFRDALVSETKRENDPIQQAIQAVSEQIAAKEIELATLCQQADAKEAALESTCRDCDTQMARLTEVMDALQAP